MNREKKKTQKKTSNTLDRFFASKSQHDNSENDTSVVPRLLKETTRSPNLLTIDDSDTSSNESTRSSQMSNSNNTLEVTDDDINNNQESQTMKGKSMYVQKVRSVWLQNPNLQ
ncbi:uncharacterized protein LOC119605385 [Lucilia sericata]|uniref:uncharacterized protein LOC119605385 n=1 Tax=Lucilia sericata TaxID=13632 RepID=UPI0018A83BB8|nr:uncharacterized protein LOC119605385 [Lucilia sericata]